MLIQHPPEAGGKFFPAYIEQTARAADTRKDGKGRSLAKVEASWADSRSGDHIRVRPGAFCYPLFVPAFSFKCSSAGNWWNINQDYLDDGCVRKHVCTCASACPSFCVKFLEADDVKSFGPSRCFSHPCFLSVYYSQATVQG